MPAENSLVDRLRDRQYIPIGPMKPEDTEEPSMRFPAHEVLPEDLGEDGPHLEMVRCETFVRLAALDPKSGTFRVRMKCVWAFRTQNMHDDAEIHMRGVPGIRMPGLVEVVEESRVWKDLSFSGSSKTTGNTVFWRGISLFTMEGFKAFKMHQFPFDRHILNLERLEFVWRSEKDAADYYKSMKLVSFTVDTSSMLPEWETLPAYVQSMNTKKSSSSAYSYASKFNVQLRIERKSQFYVLQVFVVTYLITMLTCTPLAMDPLSVGDRLAVYVGGTLTLVAFKYGVSDHLPSVPYQTFTDKFLLSQILSVFACGILTIFTYRIVDQVPEVLWIVDWVENILGMILALAWTIALCWAALLRPRPTSRNNRDSWQNIIAKEREWRDAWGMEEESRSFADTVAETAEPANPSAAEAGLSNDDFRALGLSQEQVQRIAALQAQRRSEQAQVSNGA